MNCHTWKNSCNNSTITTTNFFSYRYNPSNSWQNNIHNNIGRYLKFKNYLKFYIPYFFSSFWTKHTQKDKHTLGQNIFTTHNSKLGITNKFVGNKERTNLLKHYLPTYPPFYFVTCYFQTCIPPQRSFFLWQQKVIKPCVRHLVTKVVMTIVTMKQTLIFQAYLLPSTIAIVTYKFHMEVVVGNSRDISKFLIFLLLLAKSLLQFVV